MSGITVQITPEHRFVKLDDLNWCLQLLKERKKDSAKGHFKAGDLYWDNEYYYPTLGMACADLARILADDDKHSGEVDSLQSYADLLGRRCREVEAAVNEAIRAVEATKGKVTV